MIDEGGGIGLAIGGAHALDRESALAREAASDKDAFCQLYTNYYPRIYSFILKRIGSVSDTEDVTARTFEKALRCIDSFDSRKGSFSSWLYKIAINSTNDFLKTSRPSKVSLDELGEVLVFDTSDRTGAVQSFVDVVRMLGKLERSHQVVLVLRYLEGFEYEEIAEILECSKKAVSMRLTRAMKALKKVMREEGYLQAVRGGEL